MKTRTTFILSLTAIITLAAGSAFGKYSGGTGEPNNPYQIATAADLFTLAADTNDYNKHFVMTADIDLDPNLPGNCVFTTAVIARDRNLNGGFQGAPFIGVFDGNNHSIFNLVIDVNGLSLPSNRNWLGLFGKTSNNAVLINLGVEDVNIIGTGSNFNIGALVGENENGNIINCYTTGTLSDANHYIGGLIGNNSFGSSIIDCFSAAMVTGGLQLGGLVGINYGTIMGSYASGPVSANTNLGGLVGTNEDASITNCYSTSCVSGKDYVGGLVGYNHYGSITNSYSTGSVTGWPGSGFIGGLTGLCWFGSVTNCYATGPVSSGDASSAVGGLCGKSQWGSITNCFATGSVTGGNDSTCLGGLMGTNSSGNIIINCYSSGPVSGDSYLGGLVGYNSSGGSISNSYFIDVSGPNNGLGTPLTDVQMKQKSSFVGWDFRSASNADYFYYWVMPEDSYPALGICCGYTPELLTGSGTINNPYLVADANNLGSVWYRPSAHYRLISDINLTGINWQTAVIPAFSGSFDGNSHTITGLSINGGQFIGLFGQITDNAHVANLAIEDVNIIAGNYAHFLGGLVGRTGGIITDCYADSIIKAGNNSYCLGGLVGYSHEASITNCSTTSSVTAGNDSDSLGGLAGYVSDTSITGCGANTSIAAASNSQYLGGLLGHSVLSNTTKSYAAGNVTGYAYLGGLVGGNAGNYEHITSCYATVTVTGNNRLGGLVGQNNCCDINDCYATGPVNASGNYVGGLVGNNYGEDISGYVYGDISRCYAVADVNTSAQYVGGLVGYSDSYYLPGPTISDCFWDAQAQTHGVTQSIGYYHNNTVVNVMGLTTAQMKQQSSFVGWDFNNVWAICETTNYPRLLWLILAADLVCPDGVNFVDYSFFAKHWLDTNCATSNNCNGADIDLSGTVDSVDLYVICNYWLKGI